MANAITFLQQGLALVPQWLHVRILEQAKSN
jgi:hypothetical protein